MFTGIFKEWTHPKTVILTPNQRQARYLHQRFDSYQKEQGLKVWPTLSIFPFASWLESLWQTFEKEEQLLSNAQFSLLWEDTIRQTTPDLVKLRSLAIETWNICQAY